MSKYRFIPDLNRRDALFSKESLLAYGITPNKIYTSVGFVKKRTRHKTSKDFLKIINDYNEESFFNSDWFKPIEEEREEKLNKLGI